MLKQISEEVRVNLKDRLRDARHAIRQSRHDSTGQVRPLRGLGEVSQFPVDGVEAVLGHAASAVDDALSAVESLVRRDSWTGAESHAVKGFEEYFPIEGHHADERRFRRDMYYLTKAVLAGLKIDDARIHEVDFAAVHAAIIKRHAALLDRPLDSGELSSDIPAIASLCSALLVELLEHRPIRFFDPTRQMLMRKTDPDLEIRCLAPVALCCGLATKLKHEVARPHLVESAIMAADIRHDRFVSAAFGADPASELTAVFSMLLAHLP